MWFIGVETSAPPPKKILDPPLQYYGHLSIMSSNEYLILASTLRLRFALLKSKRITEAHPETDQHVHASVSRE